MEADVSSMEAAALTAALLRFWLATRISPPVVATCEPADINNLTDEMLKCAAKMEFEYEIRFADSDILATTGRTTHCCVNRSNKPMPIKKADSELFETLKNLLEK